MFKLQSRLLSICVFSAAVIAAHPALAETTPGEQVIATADPSTYMGATQGSTIHSQQIAPDAGPSPYQVKLQYTGEEWDNAYGGIRTGMVYLQNVDAQLKVDTDKAFGWTGGKFFVDGFWNSSRSLDKDYNGTVQDASVIDTAGTSMFRLYQAYYDQNFSSTGTDVLFGVYDPETEFDNTAPMNVFFNGAYAWTSTLDQSGGQGLNGPSNYPNTALGLRVRQTLNSQWSIQGVISDGMADSVKYPQNNDYEFQSRYGAFGIGEVDYEPIKHTKLMAGFWGYTGKFDQQFGMKADGAPVQTYGSEGGYIGGATRLYELEGRRGLDGFVNIGFADPVVNQTDRTLNAGLTFTGPFDARPTDKIGFAASIIGDSYTYKKAQIAAGNSVNNYETNFELTYRAPINSWLTVQPDIQYWIDPNYDPTLKNDWLFGVHFEIGRLFNM